MRATINGVEVEGTPEEIRALLGMDKMTTPPPPPKKPYVPRRGERERANWSAEENEVGRQHYAKAPRQSDGAIKRGWAKALARKLGRSHHAILAHACEMGWSKKPPREKPREAKPQEQRTEADRKKHLLTNVLEGQRRTPGEERALAEARIGSLSRQPQAPVKRGQMSVLTDEPVEMLCVPQESKDIFWSVVKSIVANGGRLDYHNEGFALGFNSGLDWRAFCEEFMVKKARIAAFFGAPDLFEQELVLGKYHRIRYRKV
jgi:hypothetical protein